MRADFNPAFAGRPVTIFQRMSALARAEGAINLGQGFPDEDGPARLRESAARRLVEGPNQYAPVAGVPELREAIARDNQRFYGLDIDPARETLVVAGATEGLASTFVALLRPGDEAVVFAPCYDSYAPMIEAAGARVVPIGLAPPDFTLTRQALDAALSGRTKLIVLNTPHNPTGKVFSERELALVADVCRARDLILVSDEVYERLVFDGGAHQTPMALPGMRDRTIRIGSAGKTFSFTGWRIGYLTAAPALIEAIAKAHQWVAYTSPSHLQYAVAEGLSFADDYYQDFVSGMQMKRDRMRAGLIDAGLAPLACAGTYFMLADVAAAGFDGDDLAFCETLTRRAKVAAVPISAFYPVGASAPRSLVRFCFCKKMSVLDEASVRLRAFLNG